MSKFRFTLSILLMWIAISQTFASHKAPTPLHYETLSFVTPVETARFTPTVTTHDEITESTTTLNTKFIHEAYKTLSNGNIVEIGHTFKILQKVLSSTDSLFKKIIDKNFCDIVAEKSWELLLTLNNDSTAFNVSNLKEWCNAADECMKDLCISCSQNISRKCNQVVLYRKILDAIYGFKDPTETNHILTLYLSAWGGINKDYSKDFDGFLRVLFRFFDKEIAIDTAIQCLNNNPSRLICELASLKETDNNDHNAMFQYIAATKYKYVPAMLRLAKCVENDEAIPFDAIALCQEVVTLAPNISNYNSELEPVLYFTSKNQLLSSANSIPIINFLFQDPFSDPGAPIQTGDEQLKGEPEARIDAYATLGRLELFNGNYVKADSYFNKAGTWSSSIFGDAANLYKNIKNFPKYFSYIKRLVETEPSNKSAMFELGNAYCLGLGTSKNFNLGISYMKKGYEPNNIDGEEETTFGLIYLIQKNRMESKKWFTKAAKKGHHMAIEAVRAFDYYQHMEDIQKYLTQRFL